MAVERLYEEIPVLTISAAATLLNLTEYTVTRYICDFKKYLKPPVYRRTGNRRMRVLYLSDVRFLNSKTIMKKYRKNLQYPDPLPSVEIKHYGEAGS